MNKRKREGKEEQKIMGEKNVKGKSAKIRPTERREAARELLTRRSDMKL